MLYLKINETEYLENGIWLVCDLIPSDFEKVIPGTRLYAIGNRGSFIGDFLLTKVDFQENSHQQIKIQLRSIDLEEIRKIEFLILFHPETFVLVPITPPLKISQYPITKLLYKEYLSENKSTHSSQTSIYEFIGDVSWFDCIQFCNWYSEKKGLLPYYEISYLESSPLNTYLKINPSSNGYRLPTVEEWTNVASFSPEHPPKNFEIPLHIRNECNQIPTLIRLKLMLELSHSNVYGLTECFQWCQNLELNENIISNCIPQPVVGGNFNYNFKEELKSETKRHNLSFRIVKNNPEISF